MSDEPGDAPVLVEFRRGGADRIETRHRGAVAVVDCGGRLLSYAGDPGQAKLGIHRFRCHGSLSFWLWAG